MANVYQQKIGRSFCQRLFRTLLLLLFVCAAYQMLERAFSTGFSSGDDVLSKKGPKSGVQRDMKTGYLKSNRPLIMCFIPTYKESLDSKAFAVRATWGRRCDRMVFAADEVNKTFPTIKMGYPGRKMLWAKVRDTFEYFYDNYLDQYDWFYKGDDNTYVIVENLRSFLAKYDPDKPWFFGHRFKAFLVEGYNSGGPGYVLSRGALRLLGPTLKMKTINSTCMPGNQTGTYRGEDFRMGECLEKVGVVPSRTLDKKGRELFHVFNPDGELTAIKNTEWYHFFNYYTHKSGFDCCSENSISFHYVGPQYMYAMEYILYHLQPHVLQVQQNMQS